MSWKMIFATLLGLWLVGSIGSVFGQMGRASITGVVSDSTGAVVPNVIVSARNVETGVTYETRTNEAGNYTIGSLPIGQYAVSFKATGFKEFTREGLNLTSGQAARLDVPLAVGEVTETLTVTAEAPLLQTETAAASTTVDARVFKDLPLSFNQGRNMAEFASRLVPGVTGSNYTMRIQGTPGASQAIIIDGMSNFAGMLPGDFAEATVSPEAIQEMTVFTGNQAPEFGRTGGGALNFVLKSGTNQPHGSMFYYFRNEILNSNDWNNNLMLAADPGFTNASTATFKRPKHRRTDYGLSFGGPVYMPKVYDGRNRTFFFFTTERFRTETFGPTTLGRSVPQPEMFNGDLSRLRRATVVGTDVLGRSILEGQVYDPTTLREVNGQFVADPFQGNIIPPSRISQVARNFQAIFAQYYPPATTALTNNMYGSHSYPKQHRS